MKKNYFLVFLLSITTIIQAQDLLITGVVDATLTGGTPKAIELYVLNNIPDLSTYAIGSANNGDGTDGEEFFLSGNASAGDFIYIASEQPNFNTFFGFDPTFVDDTANVNGDDAIELFNNGMIIDVFGDSNVDGSGEDWEYQDGWAYRNSGTTADGATFMIDHWSFSGPNALDDESDNENAEIPFPLGTYSVEAPILISFNEELTQVSENDGVVTIPVSISEAADATVVITVTLTNDLESSFVLNTTTLTFTADGATTQNVMMNLADNTDPNQDYYIALALENSIGAEEGEFTTHTVYVLDDELQTPNAANVLGMSFTTNIEVNGAEIVTHDMESNRLFVSNAGDNTVEVIDFNDPLNLTTLPAIDMSTFGDEVTSVSAYNGTVAVAVRAADQGNGQIVFIDTDGTVLSNVEVGSLPDMVTFTPDATKVLVANEGEPSDDYTIDPEGTISVIDITGGIETLTQAEVTSLTFTNFDADQAALEAAGVRIFGPEASISQDLEPEFITVTDDSTIAYVSLQENNAYAIVDLVTPSITAVEAWGVKDHSLEENALDVSNRLDFVFMSTWNTVGMYQPDAIANYTVGGTNYIVIANEGDARDYDGFSEEVRINDLNLDPTAYPNAHFLQMDETLGRLRTTNATGDTDGDGDIDLIHTYGGRSFSIVNADTGAIVYDSQDVLERIVKEDPVYGVIFNTTDDENVFKNRSDDKGPEPEAVIVKEIAGQWYAFVGLERIGGIAVFNVTDPTAPTFETYVNNRDTTIDIENPEGDLAPEGVIYIAPEDNATGKGLIVVANEVSSTISIYTLENDTLSTEEFTISNETITIYPNPTSNGTLYFSKESGFVMYDLVGRQVASSPLASQVQINTLKTGVYLINFDNGTTQKVMIK
ncbi:choice-of-anchor I family protein [uncultured Dokdonia sp.]|uniref:choice-of-anchor I family protein n=1 Tax=uncultured Dokdonia sp. TaxID=575653 RepID=UPI00262A72D4|nr:choice-of-anchor I family protein [uncultured Dokdonia sp.]